METRKFLSCFGLDLSVQFLVNFIAIRVYSALPTTLALPLVDLPLPFVDPPFCSSPSCSTVDSNSLLVVKETTSPR
jgi:hypothetical protein